MARIFKNQLFFKSTESSCHNMLNVKGLEVVFCGIITISLEFRIVTSHLLHSSTLGNETILKTNYVFSISTQLIDLWDGMQKADTSVPFNTVDPITGKTTMLVSES